MLSESVAPIAPPSAGVVVVGGGVTGLLTALELDRRDIAALVIEKAGLCSGQTGQAHGWLHRGGVFPDAGPADCEQLDHGARLWEALLASAHFGTKCDIGGTRTETRTAVSAVWEHLGLSSSSTLAGNVACPWTIGGPESAIAPVVVLRSVLAGSGVTLRRAAAISLRPGDRADTAESLLVRSEWGTLRLKADAFVLANADGICGLISAADPASRLTRRLSFMLVVRSRAVPDRGIAIPEQDSLGLFAVPRASGQHRHLLISNFISYALTANIDACRHNWLAGIRRTVERFLPELWRADDGLWGVYSAVKVEPRRDVALGVSDMAIVSTPFVNVTAGVPGKLALAPLLARRLADTVQPYVTPRRQLREEHCLPRAQWAAEQWEVTPLARRSTLFDKVHP